MGLMRKGSPGGSELVLKVNTDCGKHPGPAPGCVVRPMGFYCACELIGLRLDSVKVLDCPARQALRAE